MWPDTSVLAPHNGRNGKRDAIEKDADLVAYLRNLTSEGVQVYEEYGVALGLLNALSNRFGPLS